MKKIIVIAVIAVIVIAIAVFAASCSGTGDTNTGSGASSAANATTNKNAANANSVNSNSMRDDHSMMNGNHQQTGEQHSSEAMKTGERQMQKGMNMRPETSGDANRSANSNR